MLQSSLTAHTARKVAIKHYTKTGCRLGICLAVLLAPGVLIGCGSNTAAIVQLLVSLLITRAAGGTITDRNATLTIPPDSLAQDTTITVQPASSLPQPPVGYAIVTDTAFTYTPAGTTFSVPATLTITYLPANVSQDTQPSTLRLYVVSGSAWVPVAGSSVNTGTHSVTGSISQLGTYAIIGPMSMPLTSQ